MNLVVVEAADAGGLDPSRLCFQIEHLTNHGGRSLLGWDARSL